MFDRIYLKLYNTKHNYLEFTYGLSMEYHRNENTLINVSIKENCWFLDSASYYSFLEF